MRKLLQYMQQLSHRRLGAFEFLDRESDASVQTPTQLLLDYGHPDQEVDGRTLRRRIADAEYDDEAWNP